MPFPPNPTRGPSRRGALALAAGTGVALAGGHVLPVHADELTWRVTGPEVAPLAHFDDVMREYMEARSISAGSLAVARGGRIALVRGYTWGGSDVATTQETDVFRIASLSKNIAGTAAMLLAQRGELDLDTPVQDLIDLTPLPGNDPDPRLGEVTVRRALQHLGGWNRDLSGDPLWTDHSIVDETDLTLPLSEEDVIAHVSGKGLDFAPGTEHAYSNYGYLLVSRVIAEVTGGTFEDFVVSDVLGPVDVARMRAGRSLAQTQEGEVRYESVHTTTTVLDGSGDQVPSPYGGFNLENQLGNGGWVASAADLVRYCTIYDTPAQAGVLTPDSITEVFAVPEIGGGATHYGLGWYVRPAETGENTWHFGSMPGTHTFLARSNGYTVAALFNRRNEGDDLNWNEIDPLLWEAVDATDGWPEEDLTPIYF